MPETWLTKQFGWGPVPDEMERFGLGDEPPAVRADREMGAEQFVLQFSDLASPETLDLFATEVMPAAA